MFVPEADEMRRSAMFEERSAQERSRDSRGRHQDQGGSKERVRETKGGERRGRSVTANSSVWKVTAMQSPWTHTDGQKSQSEHSV